MVVGTDREFEIRDRFENEFLCCWTRGTLLATRCPQRRWRIVQTVGGNWFLSRCLAFISGPLRSAELFLVSVLAGVKSLFHNLFERRIFLLCREVLG